MNNNLNHLLDEHSSAKKKLTLGIVFTAIAYFFGVVGIYTIYYAVGVVFLILSLPFFGVGIPFLVIGIINTIKSNRKIALARMSNNSNSEPAKATPINEPTVENKQPTDHIDTTPVETVQESTSTSPFVEKEQTDFVDLDWQKYNSLDAGVSYNKDKDYKFHRADGFVGSVPQKFVDRTFPKCPICCSKEPNWTISQHNQMSWKGNLYLFKCSCCESIISMSMPDVTTLGNGASGVVANPNVGLTNLMVKASSGKEAGAVYAVIESVGNSGVSRECEGKEFKLEDLQDMYLR
jgi:hypothetical protein